MGNDVLQRILNSTCEASVAPGGGAIVVSHDAVVAQAVTGVRRLNSDAAIEMSDRFHIGSNTKAWTSTICADLVDRNLITWETTPLDVFPDIRDGLQPEFREITLEMLLRHMAAVPPYTQDEHFDDLPQLAGSPAERRLAFSQWLLQRLLPRLSPLDPKHPL